VQQAETVEAKPRKELVMGEVLNLAVKLVALAPVTTKRQDL
jgi:hypothetical protein